MKQRAKRLIKKQTDKQTGQQKKVESKYTMVRKFSMEENFPFT